MTTNTKYQNAKIYLTLATPFPKLTNQLPYLPTEITDLIYDFKLAMEMKDHNEYYKELLNQIKEFSYHINEVYDPLAVTDDEDDDFIHD